MKKNNKQLKIKPLLFLTYLDVIKNSVDSNLFRNFYVDVDGVRTDVTRDGDLSCALYVSSILKLFSLINKVHTTVTNTIKDLEDSGWSLIKSPKVGSVLIWEAKTFEDNKIHTHIGFYIGNNKAISNSEKFKVPKSHHWTWGKDTSGNPTRRVTTIYWSKVLEN